MRLAYGDSGCGFDGNRECADGVLEFIARAVLAGSALRRVHSEKSSGHLNCPVF